MAKQEFEAPMLPSDMDPDQLPAILQDPNYGMERKRDGHRCLVRLHKGRSKALEVEAMNRNMTTMKLPKDIEVALAEDTDLDSLQGKDLILDGELVWVDENGGDHRTRVQAEQISPNVSVILAVWDIQDLDHTYRKRKERLLELMKASKWHETGLVQFQPTFVTTETKEKLMKVGGDCGWEGYVFKDMTAKYEPGRTTCCLRYKYHVTSDYIVVGYTESDKEKNPFRALIMASHHAQDKSLLARGQCGGGFPDTTTGDKVCRNDIWEKKLKDKPYWITDSADSVKCFVDGLEISGKTKAIHVGHELNDKDWGKTYGTVRFLNKNDYFVIEVESQGLTEYGTPYMPQFVSLREDKLPSSCLYSPVVGKEKVDEEKDAGTEEKPSKN